MWFYLESALNCKDILMYMFSVGMLHRTYLKKHTHIKVHANKYDIFENDSCKKKKESSHSSVSHFKCEHKIMNLYKNQQKQYRTHFAFYEA